jgi:hypothetical protein
LRSYTVIAPSGVFYARVSGVFHLANRPRIAMTTDLYLQPDTVSFANLQQEERDDTGFATNPGPWHCFNGYSHHPLAGWTQVGADIPGFGSKVETTDYDDSGDCEDNPPFAPGSEGDDIPDWYMVGGVQQFFATVLQQATLDGAGNLTLQKGFPPPATAQTTVAAPSSSL